MFVAFKEIVCVCVLSCIRSKTLFNRKIVLGCYAV
jgi:hypothetical protein